ncbi:MAG TPA: hypothetical protein VJG65_02210 [Patescibacteria group bacterium]|nr:hypothetical protein [Patescibacteria group bacterium]
MNKFKILKIINIFLILFFLGLLLWLFDQNFSLNGQLVIKSNLTKDLPMISKLGPEGRVNLRQSETLILDSPVYFDLRTMPWFKTARMILVYRSDGRILSGIGSQTGPGFSFAVQEPLAVNQRDDGDSEAVFDFNLASVYRDKNVTRFLIDSTSLKDEVGNTISLKSLEIILTR